MGKEKDVEIIAMLDAAAKDIMNRVTRKFHGRGSFRHYEVTGEST